MAAPTRIEVQRAWSRLGFVGVVARETPPGEYVDAQSFGVAETALQAAYMGLRSAENQFAAMRASQEAGHFPEVHNNPEKFAEKADAAAKALAELGIPTSPAPASNDLTEVRGAASGTGGDKSSSCGAGTAQAEGESEAPESRKTVARTGSDCGGSGCGDAPSYRHRGCGGAVILTAADPIRDNHWSVVCRDCEAEPGPYDVIDADLYARSL